MKEGLRKRLLSFLGAKAGVKEGKMMPKWLFVITCILHPIYSIVNLNPLFNIDVAREIVIWNKQKFSFQIMDVFTRESPTGYWFRVEKGTDGVMIVHTMNMGSDKEN